MARKNPSLVPPTRKAPVRSAAAKLPALAHPKLVHGFIVVSPARVPKRAADSRLSPVAPRAAPRAARAAHEGPGDDATFH